MFKTSDDDDDAKHPLPILMGQFLSLIPSWLKELLTFTSSRAGLFLSLQPINSSCFDKSYGIFALWGIFFYSRNRNVDVWVQLIWEISNIVVEIMFFLTLCMVKGIHVYEYWTSEPQHYAIFYSYLINRKYFVLYQSIVQQCFGF